MLKDKKDLDWIENLWYYWRGCSTGLTGDAAGVSSLVALNGTLYVGILGGGVWAWDGTMWSRVDGSAGLPDNVNYARSFLAVKGTLYVGTGEPGDGVLAWDGWAVPGGRFYGPLGLPHNCPRAWDGFAWFQVGGLKDSLGNPVEVWSLSAANGSV